MFDGGANPEVDDWLSRNRHWISETERAARPRRRRERQKEPLIICGHGVSLRVDSGTLLIRNGLTHYPRSVPASACLLHVQRSNYPPN
jgi:hypothetical protein